MLMLIYNIIQTFKYVCFVCTVSDGYSNVYSFQYTVCVFLLDFYRYQQNIILWGTGSY